MLGCYGWPLFCAGPRVPITWDPACQGAQIPRGAQVRHRSRGRRRLGTDYKGGAGQAQVTGWAQVGRRSLGWRRSGADH